MLRFIRSMSSFERMAASLAASPLPEMRSSLSFLSSSVLIIAAPFATPRIQLPEVTNDPYNFREQALTFVGWSVLPVDRLHKHKCGLSNVNYFDRISMKCRPLKGHGCVKEKYSYHCFDLFRI